MERLVTQLNDRLTLDEQRAFAAIRALEHGSAHLTNEQFEQVVSRSQHGRTLVTHVGATLARSISMPSMPSSSSSSPPTPPPTPPLSASASTVLLAPPSPPLRSSAFA